MAVLLGTSGVNAILLNGRGTHSQLQRTASTSGCMTLALVFSLMPQPFSFLCADRFLAYDPLELSLLFIWTPLVKVILEAIVDSRIFFKVVNSQRDRPATSLEQ